MSVKFMIYQYKWHLHYWVIQVVWLLHSQCKFRVGRF